jgi:hypothetical protein
VNIYVPSVVAVTFWVAAALAVAGYTIKSYTETA